MIKWKLIRFVSLILFLVASIILPLIPSVVMASTCSDTVVIAAYNSYDNVTADYICDGVSDEVQINQAINSIPKGKVKLLDGTYNITSSIIVKSNMIMEGQGWSTVIKGINFGLGTYADALICSAYQVDIEGFVARDFLIDGQRGTGVNSTSNAIRLGVGAQARHCRLTNISIKNIYSIGIAISGVYSEDVVIDKCFIDNTAKDCIYLLGMSHKVVDNDLRNTLDTAIAFVYEGGVSPRDGFVEGNRIYNCVNGIILDGMQGGCVSSNIIDTINSGCGILVGGYPTSPRPTNIIVNGNKVSNCAAIGIYLYKAKYCIVADNVVFNNDKSNASWGGITTYSDSTDFSEYNTIEDNISYDDQATPTQDYGFKEMGNSNHQQLKDNIFHGNAVAPYLVIGANDLVSGNMP